LFEGKVAKWWTPSDVVFAESLPLGATGKVLKTELRKRYSEHRWPEGV
jgi:fatty-acyl-CoA synthase